jgi:hypothetical protein
LHKTILYTASPGLPVRDLKIQDFLAFAADARGFVWRLASI